MALRSGTVKRFLSKNDIINNLYPESLSLVLPEDPRTIIVPTSSILVTYNVLPSGVVPFGGSPDLRIGYPDALNFAALAPAVPLNESISQGVYVTVPNGVYFRDLSLFVNQPLVVSLADGSAAYASGFTHSIGNPGSEYQVGEHLDPTGSDGWEVTVTAVDGGGAVTGYTVDSGNPVTVGMGFATQVMGQPVSAAGIHTPGANYAPDDLCFIAGDNGGSSAHFIIDTVDGGGGVLTGHLEGGATGSRYFSGTDRGTTNQTGPGTGLTLDITAASGSGFTLNVLSVTRGNGSLYIEFDWKDIQVPKFARYS